MCVCVCKSVSVCGLSRWYFFCKGESSRVTLKRAGSPAAFSPSHCLRLSAGHVMLSMLQYHCFGFLVLCFLSVFSTTRSPAFLWLSPSMSCDISAPSHNKTYLHSHALGTVSYFLCLSVCMSPHACGRLFCVVHRFLFCHYMLQIGGFVFYEDMCTGD